MEQKTKGNFKKPCMVIRDDGSMRAIWHDQYEKSFAALQNIKKRLGVNDVDSVIKRIEQLTK